METCVSTAGRRQSRHVYDGAMRVLLLSPEFPDTFWSFKHAVRFIHRKASSPPLGLLTVAALLPAAWEKRLVDLNIATLHEADLAWADFAFIGAMTAQRQSARAMIARCKAAGLPVVAGGPLFTAEPEAFPEVAPLVLNHAHAPLGAGPSEIVRLGERAVRPRLPVRL